MNRTQLKDARHWVIKIGSAVLLRDARTIDRVTFVSLVAAIDRLIARGHRVTVVSSGAVALGRQRLGGRLEPSTDLPRLQALAALGQSRLIQMYDAEFGLYGHRVAQILLGREDLNRRQSFLNARLTLDAVHRVKAVPIINENDSIATEELRFGDNDELAAMTCGVAQSDLLVILSDVAGLFDVEEHDGERRLTERIAAISVDDARLDHLAGPSSSGFGRGGMISKVAAARSAARFGVPTVIAAGKQPGILQQIADGRDVGTLFTVGAGGALQGKKVWLGAGALPVGTLVVDEGATRAVTEKGASLLPSGIVEVRGDFGEGAVVELVSPKGQAFARGLSVYGADDVRKIAGQHSDAIDAILGYRILDAVVHRDSLVIL